MGMLEQEYKELNMLSTMMMNGKMSAEDYRNHISMAKQKIRVLEIAMNMCANRVKIGKKYQDGLVSMQVIGDGTVMELEYIAESETVKCPDTDKIITRLQCKEYSEQTGNLGTCSTCDNFQTTRKLLGSAHKEIA